MLTYPWELRMNYSLHERFSEHLLCRRQGTEVVHWIKPQKETAGDMGNIFRLITMQPHGLNNVFHFPLNRTRSIFE